MFKIWLRLLKGLLLFILCLQLAIGFSLASDIAKKLEPSKAARKDSSSYPSKVRFGAYGSTEDRSIFYVDYLLPFYYSQDRQTILFVNPKQSWFGPHYSDELNIGSGIRHIFDDKFILGLHTFYDKKYSEKNKLYSQVGYGFEFLSYPFDFRFNYYDPHTKAKVVDSGTGGYKLGSLSLIQDSTKTYEEPLEGYDFEFGCPIIPKQLNTRVYLGGFLFNSRMAKDYNGFRARTETNLNKWLTIDNTFNYWGNGETEFIGGFRVTIPLEWKRTLAGKDLSKTAPHDTYIKERLLERVVRDIDVQARSTPAVTESVAVSDVNIIYVDNRNTVAGDGTLENPYQTIDDALLDSRYVGQGGIVKHIYIFKGDSDVTHYSGNYILADDTVIWGSNSTLGYSGLSILGLPVIDGNGIDRVFTLGNDNTIAGVTVTNGTDGIYAENKTGGTIRENTISNNSNYGIYIDNQNNNISDWAIEGNTIEDNSNDGIYIRNYAAYDGNTATMSGFTISGNTIAGNNGSGIYLRNYGYYYAAATMEDWTIQNNIIEDNSSYGIEMRNEAYDTAGTADMDVFTVSDNTFTNNTNAGMYIYNYADNSGSSDMSGFTIRDNTVTGSGNNDYGIYMENIADSATSTMSDFTIDGNTLTGGATYYYPYSYSQTGIYIHNSASNDGTAEITSEFNITGNTISDYQDDGIYIYNRSSNGYYTATLSGFTVSGNTIQDNGGNGIYIRNYASSGTADVTDFTIQDNDILNNEESGIELYNNDGTAQNLDILDNTIQNNDQYGIYLENNGGTFTDFTLENNTIQDNGSNGNYDGIYLYTDNGADIFTFRENTITGNTRNGINLQLQGGNVSDFTFDGNTITGNPGSGYDCGIYIYNNSSYVSGFDFTGNTISDNINADGIYIRQYNTGYSSMSDFTFSGNTIQNNGGNGVYIYNSYYGYYGSGTVSDFSFSGNTITGNSGDGVRFYDNSYYYNDIYNMDLGGGIMGSTGNNSIHDNEGSDLSTNTDDTVSAQSNWWGQDVDPSTTGQLSGDIDASDWLNSPP